MALACEGWSCACKLANECLVSARDAFNMSENEEWMSCVMQLRGARGAEKGGRQEKCKQWCLSCFCCALQPPHHKNNKRYGNTSTSTLANEFLCSNAIKCSYFHFLFKFITWWSQNVSSAEGGLQVGGDESLCSQTKTWSKASLCIFDKQAIMLWSHFKQKWHSLTLWM